MDTNNYTITMLNSSDQLDTLAVEMNPSEQALYKAGIALRLHWIPIIVLIGWVGNSLSLLVMVQPHNRHVSCCIYMAALAISDNFMLLISAYFWLWFFMDINSVWACKIVGFLFYVFAENGIVLVVCMTVDRFIAVIYPLQAREMNTAYRSKLTVVISLTVLCGSNISFLFTAKIRGNACVAYGSDNTSMQVLAWFKVCFNSLLPFVILVVLNAMIVKGVSNRGAIASSRFTKDSTSKEISTTQAHSLKQPTPNTQINNQEKQKLSSKDKQLVAMLTVVTMALLFLTLPLYLRYIIYNFYDYRRDARSYALYTLLYHVTNCLYYTNNGVNFFLYALSGSKFRQDVKSVICCIKVMQTSSHSTRKTRENVD